MTPKHKKEPIRDFHLYLISDATGTTLQGLARAVLAQFDDVRPVERFWPMVRSEAQLDRAILDLREHPGPVLFTLVDKKLRKKLQEVCHELDIPCMPVLDPMLRGMSAYLGLKARGVPGLQHMLDEAYFKRMDAVDFALDYDDGQDLDGIEEADVILVGVSRTSKTPTCIFLARRGVRAANIPLAMEVPFPEEITKHKGPLFVGLTESPERLVHLRRNRLHAGEGDARYAENTYLDLDKVEEEMRYARRLAGDRCYAAFGGGNIR
jgi:regulator of PEP synthase PpsR (kinase-PPPase family)